MRVLALALLAACGSSGPTGTGSGSSIKPPPTLSSPTELSKSPALMPLAWLRGDWETWHWSAAGGALYGVMLGNDGKSFAIMIIDDAAGPGPADGTLRSYASSDGEPLREGDVVAGDRALSIVEKTDAGPVEQAWSWDGEKLHVKIQVADAIVNNTYANTSPQRAAEVEAADRAFSDDVGKRGIDGWMAAFAADGTMLRKNAVIQGAAISDMMKPLLDSGTLAWAPLASHVVGNRGYTVGTATFTGKDPKDTWRSSYVTIWGKQPDGSWKVRFDTGRPVNE